MPSWISDTFNNIINKGFGPMAYPFKSVIQRIRES